MKKSFLLLLISIMTVFLIAGCAEETTDGGDTTTPPSNTLDLTNPSTLVGFYEITFFYTDGAKVAPLSSNCADASKYVDPTFLKTSYPCDTTDMKGYAQITVDPKAGTGKLVTKIQMTSTKMTTDPTWGDTLRPQQYNYTEFNQFPLSAIKADGINSNHAIRGTYGRNLTDNINPTAEPAYPQPNNSANTDYSFTVDANSKDTLVNTMIDRSNIMEANVIVRMKKIQSLPEGYIMDKDVKFPLPVIEGFVEKPAK